MKLENSKIIPKKTRINVLDVWISDISYFHFIKNYDVYWYFCRYLSSKVLANL